MATQVKHGFIVTSAVNSKFGVYKPHERLEQTLSTVQCLRERVPGCHITLMECAGTPLTPEQDQALDSAVDVFYDFTQDPDVLDIYQSDNWDVVKNTTEIMCFARVLRQSWEDGDFAGLHRIHKMSGRYLLNDDFDLTLYEQHPDRIIIGPKCRSQFPVEMTGIQLQYMARLWSWPAMLTPQITQVYLDSLNYIAQRVSQGGYADIEHVLYHFLPADLVTEVPVLGVVGNIAPNGTPIKN